MIEISNNVLIWKLVNLGQAITIHNLKTTLSTLAISLSFYLIGCSDNSQRSGTQSLFSTKAEAENAAKNFNCTGAHKMGEKWMPCESHAAHGEGAKHPKHGNSGHHHNH